MHTELNFENALEQSLLTDGGYEQGDPKQYDKSLALFPNDIIRFIQTTQPKIYERIERGNRDKTQDYILRALDASLKSQGALNVLRSGFKCYGKTVKMAYYAPNTSINKNTAEQYGANILTVTRQLHTEHDEIPDVVLSINGIPIVTIELKNELSSTNWTVDEGIEQYRNDRNPNGRLYDFKSRTLVHFAVDTDLVYMTTRLTGKDTKFLPFNRGYNNGAGNPPVTDKVRTHYLWDKVLTKDSLLDIIGRFMHLEVKEHKIKTDAGFTTKTSETMIFPRFHQLGCVRKLTAHSRAHGSGHNYLIQHSAGSGKSNSIAWLAHHLSSMHNENDGKVFNSIIVVTDRVVLDRQLQETIAQFEHKDGVVKKIDGDSKQLAKAIVSDTQIIITTIQKFPFVIKAIEKQRAEGSHLDLVTKDKRFAIIVDEAHSSQSGENATELRKVLNQDGIASAIAQEFLDDEDDLSEDEKMIKIQAYKEAYKRQRQPNLSFFAFTATPKWRTLAIFDEPGDNAKSPFHLYSMKQAIQEGFILDVLKNYTTYTHYFKLLKVIENDRELAKNQTKKELLRFVNLCPQVIAQKVEIIIEHFNSVTRHLIGGRAKAMVVTESRESAVKYKLAFDDYVKEKSYTGIKSLVAFSGKLKLADKPEKEYTEVKLNNGIKEKQLVDYFDTNEYQVLLVADKYQTGFDQPLLHTMFVDKRLSGVQAVQTLSRLNRTENGKVDTFVLDFVNEREDIYSAFKTYYEDAEAGEVPDEHKLEELANSLDEWRIYFNDDVVAYSDVVFKQKRNLTGKEHGVLNSILDPSVDKFKSLDALDNEQRLEKQNQFKSQLQSYLNLYLFVSQIIPYADTEHERRYVYLNGLIQKIRKVNQSSTVDISQDVVLKYYRLQKISDGSITLETGEAKGLKGSTDVGTGASKKTDNISKMVGEINEAFGTNFTLGDQVFFDQIIVDALNSDDIKDAIKANTLETFTDYLYSRLLDLFINRLKGFEEACETVLSDKEIKATVSKRLAKQLYESFKEEQ